MREEPIRSGIITPHGSTYDICKQVADFHVFCGFHERCYK